MDNKKYEISDEPYFEEDIEGYTDEEYIKQYQATIDYRNEHMDEMRAPTIGEVIRESFDKIKNSQIGQKMEYLLGLCDDYKKIMSEINERKLNFSEIGLTDKEIEELDSWMELRDAYIKEMGKATIDVGTTAVGMGVAAATKTIDGAIKLGKATIKGVKKFGENVSSKYKETERKVLAAQIRAKRKILEKKQDAKDYLSEKKDKLKTSIEDKKVVAKLMKENAKKRIVKGATTVKDGVLKGIEKGKQTYKDTKENIKDNYQTAKTRFEKRKNDTLIKVLGAGASFSKKLLEGIENSVKSKQEILQQKNERITTEPQKADKKIDTMEM